ncbi:hypothetical protein [Streptomyces griseorubiginosus]|uniref:hypothetical protein n=1 Tax=Streptomyces griseorubiginosus TaxID=67304 RepID=UPI002E8160E9|nr:hypothetical protein [Streptomyces griseorubiginosus]WUB45321.1 hypothetical protein OHN19_19000 [Streptomyces griseorubiginosus]WUB53838.1 hypothetical protein OG942_18995 [Streptomyces griseorubiginosus]
MATNVEATSAEIAQLHVEDRSPGLAQLALTLARLLDGEDGATAKANVGRELRAVMVELRKLAPVAAETDRVDELAKKRQDGRIRARRA